MAGEEEGTGVEVALSARAFVCIINSQNNYAAFIMLVSLMKSAIFVVNSIFFI